MSVTGKGMWERSQIFMVYICFKKLFMVGG